MYIFGHIININSIIGISPLFAKKSNMGATLEFKIYLKSYSITIQDYFTIEERESAENFRVKYLEYKKIIEQRNQD